VTRDALAQLPGHQAGRRPGRRVLIRTDGGRSSHAFLDWLTNQRLSYSVGVALPNNTGELLAMMAKQVWTPAYNSDGAVREGAWVAELTGMLTLTGWPKCMRVIARKERPHPGPQLRITDRTGCGSPRSPPTAPAASCPIWSCAAAGPAPRTVFAAPRTPGAQPPAAQLRAEPHWCAVVTLAAEITAWMQLLALPRTNARRWEPKRLRLRLFTIAATLTWHGRATVLTLNQRHPWATLAHDGITALRVATTPG